MSAIYIHIPFCQKICPFCAFPVLPDDGEKHDMYVHFIQQELELLPEKLKQSDSPVKSVYFGGGTPSRLSAKNIGILTGLLRQHFQINSDAQWSIELNPEDVSVQYLKQLNEMGFNRISLGIQSFNETHLKVLGRVHDGKTAEVAIDKIVLSGFKNFNLDLMYGFPGQTIQTLKADLNVFVQKKATHISAYGLDIEKKTKLNRRNDWKEWQSDNEVLVTQMYDTIVSFLCDHGYEQYEISNFSQPGFRSVQNELNWKGKNYLGFGMGAHSYIHPYRWANARRWVDYKKFLNQSELPRQFLEELTIAQQRDETIMVQLRLSRGLSLDEFSLKYSIKIEELWRQKLNILIDNHLLTKNKKIIKLTNKGMMLADEIASSLAALIPE